MATALKRISELPVKTSDFSDGDLIIVSEYSGGSYVAKSKNAFSLGLIPVGGGCEWYGATAPAGYLFQDGSAVSRTTYATLFARIGTIWGAGDGSTTFNLPDKREAASVGIGTRASGVVSHDAFALAEFKDDQGQGHWHSTQLGGGGGDLRPLTDGTGTAGSYSADSIVGSPVSDSVNGTPRTGPVTRGKRIGVNFIIKY